MEGAREVSGRGTSVRWAPTTSRMRRRVTHTMPSFMRRSRAMSAPGRDRKQWSATISALRRATTLIFQVLVLAVEPFGG